MYILMDLLIDLIIEQEISILEAIVGLCFLIIRQEISILEAVSMSSW
jgi:hypothetical protein